MKCFYNCDKPVTNYIKSKTHLGDVVYAAICDEHMKIQKGRHKIISESEFLVIMIMES